MATLTFHEVLRSRYSCRSYLPQEVPGDIIKSVLEDAQLSPSNCNTQPWEVHIVSGQKQKDISAKLIEAYQADNYSPDFTFDTAHFNGRYKERQFDQGKTYYESLGVAREDKEGRRDANLSNFTFYNAPHVAFLFMPDVGDNVRVAGDIGMYGQTFLLSLTAHGLNGVPQTVLGLFADVIRKELGVSENYKMMFGISFGYEDKSAAANNFKLGRDPVDMNVTFHA